MTDFISLADQLENGDDEHYQVARIKAHLLTVAQKQYLYEHNVSIEDMLNGRIEGDVSPYMDMFRDWNTKLGRKVFLVYD
jgi:hypothetical protein